MDERYYKLTSCEEIFHYYFLPKFKNVLHNGDVFIHNQIVG